MTDSRPSSPSQAELQQRDGVLLIVDSVQPPSGPVPKGQAPVLKPREQGLFIALCGSGEIYAFNGHVDLGTGVRTALGQIVAEELYLRMDQVQMVLGDTERAPNQGATIASATLQISAVPLRNAAAEARRWLLRQAAQRFDASVEQLTLEEGVIRSPQGQALSYAELVAGGHVELSISGDAPLKPQAEYRLVGTSAARVDIPAKATGETTYVHDMRLPNMLHGRVVRPPYAGYDSGEFVGTSLLAVDETSIAHIPGIVKLVVIGDFIGIVAEREEQAIKAAQALQVSWKDWRRNLPQMTDVAQALRDNPHSTRVVHDTGDVDAALAAADRRFTRSYLWPYQLHASIGPSCALVDYRPERLQVWSGSQNPHLLRADLAWLLEYPEAQIEIVRMETAGCYGRNCADDVCADAALLSRAVGRPVRVQLTREQEHVWEPKGTAQLMEVDGGLDAAGHPVAYDFRTYYPSNGAPTLALLLTGRVEPLPVAYEMGDRTSVPPYEYPALRVSIEDMAPIVRASWMRGVSALPNTFAHESYIDELAHAAGVDPLEYRLRYIHDERASELMRSTAERAGWTPHTEPMQTPAEDGVLRGRGFAYARYIHSKFPGFGAAWAAWVADVAIDKASGEVAVTRIVVGHDAGMMVNPDGVRHQIHGNVLQSTSRVLKERVTFEESTVSAKEWGGLPDPDLPGGAGGGRGDDAAPLRSVAGRRGVGVGVQRGGHRQRGVRRHRHSFSRAADHLGQAARGAERAGRRATGRTAQEKEARQMVVRRCGGAVRRGAGHRGQRPAMAGGDRTGGDARRRHLVGRQAGARSPAGRRRRLRGLPYRVGRGDQRRRAGDGDAVRHALQHQHYPGRGNRHRQLVIYRVRSGDAPGHRPRRPPSVSGISLHRLQ